MTRINCVDPALLINSHLIAEYRELPRTFALVRKAIERGAKPSDYTQEGYHLGTGHVKLFYPRLEYLFKRQKALVKECLTRGYKIVYTSPESLCLGIPDEWFNDWTPTVEDVKANVARLMERGGLRDVRILQR